MSTPVFVWKIRDEFGALCVTVQSDDKCTAFIGAYRTLRQFAYGDNSPTDMWLHESHPNDDGSGYLGMVAEHMDYGPQFTAEYMEILPIDFRVGV